MTLQEKVKLITAQLKKEYPIVDTPLKHSNVFELLVAAILSPQTTDETTNKVTPAVFKKYPTPELLAKANYDELLKMILPSNYNKTKAKHLIEAAKILVTKFDSKVPYKIEDLITLPGVGRKVANVVINEWYARPPHPQPLSIEDGEGGRRPGEVAFESATRGTVLPVGFVVDTHVMRVSRMLGLTKNTNPKKVEQDLMKIFPKEEWADMSLRLIFHGREINTAKNPRYKEHEFWKDMYNLVESKESRVERR